MNKYNTEEYFNDLNIIKKTTLINNLKSANEILLKIIQFFMLNNIKFYSISNNTITIKSINCLILEINEKKNKILNEVIMEILKLINLDKNINELKNELNNSIKYVEEIDELKDFLIKHYYNFYELLNSKPDENNNIIENYCN